MKYQITAQAFDRESKKAIGESRTETIDTEKNSIFRYTQNAEEVKDAFENYWNNLNPASKEIVHVHEINQVINPQVTA